MYGRRSNICLFLLALSVLLVGCGPSLEERLIGTWKADLSSKAAEFRAEAEDNPLAELKAKAAEIGGITVQFKREGQLALQRKLGVISIDTAGVWKIVDASADPPQIEIRYPKPRGDGEVLHQTEVTFENDNRLQMKMKTIGDQVELLPFDRVTEE
jgi:hypothetical protein